MRAFWPALVICLLGFVQQQARSTNEVGVISGIVVDAAGAAISGATVTLRAGQRVERSMVTNNRGEFRFEKVSSGSYQIDVALSGFSTLTTRLTVGDTALAPLRLTLRLGAVQESVSARAESPLIDAASAKVAAPPVQAAARRMATASHAGPPVGRLQHRGLRPDRREPVPPRRRRAALDVLDRRRHGVLRERPPVSQPGHAAAARRGAHRGADQLLPLRLSGADRRTRRSRSRPRWRRARGTRAPPCAHRAAGDAASPTEAHAAAQPRLPARRVRLDDDRPTSCRSSRRRCGCSSTRSPSATASRSSSTPARAGSCCRRRPAIARPRSTHAIADLEAGRLDQRRRRAFSSPTRSRASTSSRAASTASSSRPTATSTSASPARASSSG